MPLSDFKTYNARRTPRISSKCTCGRYSERPFRVENSDRRFGSRLFLRLQRTSTAPQRFHLAQVRAMGVCVRVFWLQSQGLPDSRRLAAR